MNRPAILKEKVSFTLKAPKPAEKRTSWSILRCVRSVGGKRTYQKVEHEALNAINDLYQRGLQPYEEAHKQALSLKRRLIIESWNADSALVFNEANIALLGEMDNPAPGTYWKEVYGRRKRIVDRRSSYYDLRRAVEAVGTLSLLTATEDELQRAIDSRGFPDNKQRRIISRLEPILKWLKRDIKLEKARPVHEDVRYLTMTEFHQVLPHIENEEFRFLCGLAIHSGLRLGELFALKVTDLRDRYLQVDWQMDIKWAKRPTKTRGRRKAYLFPGGEEWFKSWAAVGAEKRQALRTQKLAEIFKLACSKAFPTRPDKWCVFHDLRHSYAIALIEKTVPLSFVARSLGNSEVVCEKYYTGFVLTDGFIEAINALVERTPEAPKS